MTGPRNRRALLRTGALAVSAGLAGCVDSLGDEAGDDPPSSTTVEAQTPTRDTNRTTTETSETTPAGPPLAVEDVGVQSSFFYRNYPDTAAVAAADGTQFVFAEVTPTGSDVSLPSSDELALVADDRRFEGTLTPGPVDSPRELYERGDAYDFRYLKGWVAFEVPDPLDAGEVALTYESEGRRFSGSVDSETVESLARPSAEFELVEFDVPESVEQDERYGSFRISVTVENASETDGIFRAVLNQTSPSYGPHPIEGTVSAGEEYEWARTFSVRTPDDADEVASFTLLTPGGSHEATVGVASETTDEA